MNVLFPSELFYYLKAYLTVQGDMGFIFIIQFFFQKFHHGPDFNVRRGWPGSGTDKPISDNQ